MNTTTTITPRPVAEIEDDIRRYSERLHIHTVLASSHWANETHEKLNAAQAELAAAQRVEAQAARAARDARATLAAVQHGARRVAGNGGAR